MCQSNNMSEIQLCEFILNKYKKAQNQVVMINELAEQSLNTAKSDNIHPDDTLSGVFLEWIFEYIQQQNKKKGVLHEDNRFF